ncbi:1144_t:CDS:2, partial [Acaulospora colombiana]
DTYRTSNNLRKLVHTNKKKRKADEAFKDGEYVYLYGILRRQWNVVYLMDGMSAMRNGTLYNYGETMECCKLYGWNGHRKILCDVDVFWKRIELNIELQSQLQNVEVEGTSSLISTSAEALKTAIGNINYSVGNINNTLKLSGNQIDNSTPGSVIGRKRTCENEELPSTPPNKTGEKSPAEPNLEERAMKSNGEEITDVLVRDMSERSYIVECLSPILRAFRNAFPEVKYEWIEKDVKTLKDASDMFAINVRARKTDLLVLRLSDAMEILHVEVSGPPYKPEKKHTVGDAKKLLMMAVCNLFDDTGDLREWINLPDEDLTPIYIGYET